jgi:hypothetical protein
VAFLRNYVVRRGFRDGTAGFLISILNSYYVFLKILKLWELQRGLNASARGDAVDARRRRKFERAPNADRQSSSPKSEPDHSSPSSLPSTIDTPPSNRHPAIGNRH